MCLGSMAFLVGFTGKTTKRNWDSAKSNLRFYINTNNCSLVGNELTSGNTDIWQTTIPFIEHTKNNLSYITKLICLHVLRSTPFSIINMLCINEVQEPISESLGVKLVVTIYLGLL